MLAIIVVVGPFQDALFGFVLVVNAGVGIVQELRAKRTLDRLSRAHRPEGAGRPGRAESWRFPWTGSCWTTCWSSRAAGQVVVDGEVLVSDGLELDESLLSGEPEPVSKRPGDRGALGFVRRGGLGSHGGNGGGRRRVRVEARVRGQPVHARPLGAARRGRPDPALGDVRDRADRRAPVLQPAAPPRQLAPGRVGCGRRHGRHGAGRAGPADEHRVRRGGHAPGQAATCWCRSCRPSRGSRGSTCCASTRPERSPPASSRSSPSSPSTQMIGSSRRSRRSRPPTNIPTRPWPRSRSDTRRRRAAGRRRPRCRSPRRGNGAPSRSRIRARGSSAAPTC